jgi:putative transposase
MPEYQKVHSQVLQDVLRRVDRGFANFFERLERRKMGAFTKAGYPRFKPAWRYSSITYPQAQNYKIIDGHVVLPKIGELRVFMHRNPIGEIKTMTVKRDRVGDWYIMLTAELPDVPRKTPQLAIGIDVGLIKLVQASSGEFVEVQQFYKKSETKLKRAHASLSRKAKGSKNWTKARIKVAKAHRKIQRQRDDFLHKVSKELVSRADLLVFENLRIQPMMSNHRLSKAIDNASWGRLFRHVSYKASSAGKTATRVDPKGDDMRLRVRG